MRRKTHHAFSTNKRNSPPDNARQRRRTLGPYLSPLPSKWMARRESAPTARRESAPNTRKPSAPSVDTHLVSSQPGSYDNAHLSNTSDIQRHTDKVTAEKPFPQRQSLTIPSIRSPQSRRRKSNLVSSVGTILRIL